MQKKVQNARKFVLTLRSKGYARKLIRFKVKIFLLKNSLPGRFIRGESCEHDLGSLFVYTSIVFKKKINLLTQGGFNKNYNYF